MIGLLFYKNDTFFLYISIFTFLGRNNTHPLNNNDEISLSLKKHKGKEARSQMSNDSKLHLGVTQVFLRFF